MKGGHRRFRRRRPAWLDKRGALKAPSAFFITGDDEGPAINGTVKMLQWMAAQGR